MSPVASGRAGQLGGTAQQIQGVQLGTIEAFVTPPDFLVGIDPRELTLGKDRSESHGTGPGSPS